MTSASIPVDLINPGQVLASLGFLETADALCSGAVGGFDWTNEADVRFNLHAAATRIPSSEFWNSCPAQNCAGSPLRVIKIRQRRKGKTPKKMMSLATI